MRERKKKQSLKMVMAALLVMMSMLLEGFIPASGAYYDTDSADQKKEEQEESEYFWNDGYYRAFLDSKTGKHLVGINVPSEDVVSQMSFTRRSDLVGASFITAGQKEEQYSYVSVSLNLSEPRDWDKISEMENAGSIMTMYGNTDVYTYVDDAVEGQGYRYEYAALSVDDTDVFIRAYYYPSSRYGVRETSSDNEIEYLGVLEHYLGQMLNPVESFEFEMPEYEKNETDIDPGEYDAVLAVQQMGEPVPVLGLLLPEDADMQNSRLVEDNIYDYIFIYSTSWSLQIHDTRTNYTPLYRYFEKDSPYLVQNRFSVEATEPVGEVMTGSGKLTIYKVDFAEEGYGEIALISNNGANFLIELISNDAENYYEGPSITDFFDVAEEGSSNAENKAEEEDTGYFWNDGYYRGFLDKKGEHLIGLNVPSADSVSADGFETDRYSAAVGFEIGENGDDLHTEVYIWFSLRKPDESDEIPEMEYAGSTETRYGDADVYTCLKELVPGWVCRYEYAELDIDGTEVFITAEYYSATGHGTYVESSEPEYQGVLDRYLENIFSPMESFDFELPEIEKSEIEIDPAEYDAVLAVRGNEDTPVLGLSVPFGANTQFSTQVEDNIYSFIYITTSEWSLEISDVTDGSVLLYRYFEKNTPFIDKSKPPVERVELIEDVMTGSGELKVYKVIYEGESDYEEVALINNNGIDLLIMLFGRDVEENYTGEHIINFFDASEKDTGITEETGSESADSGYYRYRIGDYYHPDYFGFNIPEEYRITEIVPLGSVYMMRLYHESGGFSMTIRAGSENMENYILKERAEVETAYGDITINSVNQGQWSSTGETAVIPIDDRSIVTINGNDLEKSDSNDMQLNPSMEYLGILEDLLPAMLQSADEEILPFDFEGIFPEDANHQFDTDSYEYVFGFYEDAAFGLNLSEHGWATQERETGDYYHDYDNTLRSALLTDTENARIHIDTNNSTEADRSHTVYVEYGYYFLDDEQFVPFIGDDLAFGLSVVSVTEEESLETDFGTIALYYVEKEDEDGNVFEEELGMLLNNEVYTIFRYNEVFDDGGSAHYKVSDGEYDGRLRQALEELMSAS